MAKCSDYAKLMGQVDEVGLRDPKVIKEAAKTCLSNQANSMTNAVLAYSKMTGQKPIQEQTQRSFDPLRMVGAVQAIKELVEGKEGMKKDTVEDTFKSIKKIIDSFN